MAKICITMACICFTLLVLPNLSNSRYLLVELDGLPDTDPGMDVTTEGLEMPEPEEEQIDDLEPETFPEDDEYGDMAEQEQKPTHAGSRILSNLTQSLIAAGGGYRSNNVCILSSTRTIMILQVLSSCQINDIDILLCASRIYDFSKNTYHYKVLIYQSLPNILMK